VEGGDPASPSPWRWTGTHVDGPSPMVVDGGPGGWNRTSLATLALASLALVALA
jgi:hypothetical protein